jgi:hypothetical protein
MLVSPSKLNLERIVKNRTLNFETTRKTHQNLVLVGAPDNKALEAIIISKLFRPQQMMSIFIPRIIRPMGRKPTRLNQKEYYSDIKTKTNGKIKIGKINPNIYNGLNMIYNTIPEYTQTAKLAGRMKSGVLLQKYLYGYFENLLNEKMEEVQYEKKYLIFPMVDFIPAFKAGVLTDYNTINPLLLFLRGIKRNNLDFDLYKKFDLIIFYNPNADALYPLDMKKFDPEKDYTVMFSKINRLNNFNNGTDVLDDVVADAADLSDEDEAENTKEEIKELILSKMAKKIKADNLTDFEAANKDEKDIILAIDRKIDKYLENPLNLDKPFSELVGEIGSDQEIKVKAIKYVESKKATAERLAQLSKNLEKEVEIIGNIEDLDAGEGIIEADRFEVEDVDERVKESKLSSLDEEYNKKQFKKDMMNILAGFSSSYYLPLTIDSFKIEDTSDDFKQVETIFVKFKTDEGKNLSFSLDIPKIVDKRYFYLGGNKKVMTKQLVRLPIVKTKEDRVEITTNYNKITIERTNGKLSRKNAYLLKLLKDIKNDQIEIEFGSNSIVNSNFTSDFEYEELADSLSRISNPKYEIMFNRKELQEEIDMMDIDDAFFNEKMTPIGLNKIKNGLLYLEDKKVHEYIPGTGGKELAEGLFEFIYENILGKSKNDKLPNIGKSYIYSKMKILGETYPVFVVVGLMNGITDVLKRYKVNYKISPSKLAKDPNYVEIQFKDKYLYYEDTIRNTLLLNILYTMGTETYEFADFDTDGPYTDYFIEKLDQPIYIRNTLRINLNVMIDPITKEVLKDMKLPTDPIDLLLLANTMLTNNSYRPQNDIRNFRVRGNEIVNAMMYQILADAYVRYQRGKLNGRNVESLNIPRELLISRLLAEPNVNDHSTLNPVNF